MKNSMISADLDEIRSFIVETFLFGDGNHISNKTPLLERHIVDSTGILEIVGFLEEKYQIRVEDKELIPENLKSIENIYRYLESKIVTRPKETAGPF
jgi:acyl carrier protein